MYSYVSSNLSATRPTDTRTAECRGRFLRTEWWGMNAVELLSQNAYISVGRRRMYIRIYLHTFIIRFPSPDSGTYAPQRKRNQPTFSRMRKNDNTHKIKRIINYYTRSATPVCTLDHIDFDVPTRTDKKLIHAQIVFLKLQN